MAPITVTLIVGSFELQQHNVNLQKRVIRRLCVDCLSDDYVSQEMEKKTERVLAHFELITFPTWGIFLIYRKRFTNLSLIFRKENLLVLGIKSLLPYQGLILPYKGIILPYQGLIFSGNKGFGN